MATLERFLAGWYTFPLGNPVYGVWTVQTTSTSEEGWPHDAHEEPRGDTLAESWSKSIRVHLESSVEWIEAILFTVDVELLPKFVQDETGYVSQVCIIFKIIRRRRGEYWWIKTETKSRFLFTNIHRAWGE